LSAVICRISTHSAAQPELAGLLNQMFMAGTNAHATTLRGPNNQAQRRGGRADLRTEYAVMAAASAKADWSRLISRMAPFAFPAFASRHAGQYHTTTWFRIPEPEDRRLAGYFAGVVAAGAALRTASTPFRA
jgi:hypothetical protein